MDDIINRLTENEDPRTNNLFLVDCPKTVIAILLIYFATVKVIGPKLMERRKAFELKGFVNFYNIFQVLACGYLVFKFLIHGAFHRNFFRCKPTEFSFDEDPAGLAQTVWLAYLLKYVDLIETLLFILRKKSNQVSFLHVYHHAATVWVIWVGTRYHAGGFYAQVLTFNNFVHVCMFMYYSYSVNASTQSRAANVIYKKLVTRTQIVQFIFLIFVGSQSFFVDTCAKTEFWGALLMVPYLSSLLYLFIRFYKKTYHIKSRTN